VKAFKRDYVDGAELRDDSWYTLDCSSDGKRKRISSSVELNGKREVTRGW